MELITQYSAWYIVLCLLLGVVYASFFYWRNSKLTELSSSLKIVLFCFRTLVVSIISFLLLSPFVKSVSSTVEKPILVLAVDNSASVGASNTKLLRERIEEINSAFAAQYELNFCSFGDKVKYSDSLSFTDKTTNFSTLFEEVETRYSNKNVGGVVVVSDGVYNSGLNPAYAKKLKNVPVFSVLVGDTSTYKDLFIKELFFNNLTYLGNNFPVEVVIGNNACLNEQTTVSLSIDGETKKSEEIKITKSLLNYKTLLRAEKTGMHKLTVNVKTLRGEKIIQNNTREVYIEVLDGRQKILILGQGPHPDLGAIKSAVESNDNYQVDLSFFKEFKGNIEQYNVLMLHQMPEDVVFGEKLLQKALSRRMGVCVVLGTQTKYNTLGRYNLGVQWANLASARAFNDVYPLVSKDFTLFSIDESTKEFLSDIPPLKVPFTQFSVPGDAQVFAYQQVGKVETDLPLISFYSVEESKMCLIAGEGIWRWKMNDFMKNESDVHFKEIMQKTVQYISVKEDKSNFKINHKKKFLENEEILFDAELYDDSYELFNKSEVGFKLVNEKGKEFNYVFEPINSRYRLNVGYLLPGSYKYTSQTMLGTKRLEKKGKFVVEEMNLEGATSKADVFVMKQL
ncbi:MAG: hypothetical protein ACO3EE_09880, partial [Flavobacteriales bacterium]